MKKLAALSLAFCLPSLAGASDALKPTSWTQPVQPLETVERVVMPAVDEAALKAEDERRFAETMEKVLRYAAPLPVDLSPDRVGTWENLAGGDLLWRLRIHSASAKSINLGFTEYFMPQGGRLFVYSMDQPHGDGQRGGRRSVLEHRGRHRDQPLEHRDHRLDLAHALVVRPRPGRGDGPAPDHGCGGEHPGQLRDVVLPPVQHGVHHGRHGLRRLRAGVLARRDDLDGHPGRAGVDPGERLALHHERLQPDDLDCVPEPAGRSAGLVG